MINYKLKTIGNLSFELVISAITEGLSILCIFDSKENAEWTISFYDGIFNEKDRGNNLCYAYLCKEKYRKDALEEIFKDVCKIHKLRHFT